LYHESKAFYDRTLLIHPLRVKHIIDPEKNTSSATYKNELLSDATSLIIRSTYNCEESSRLLAMNLFNNHCELLDPLERFHGMPAAKSSLAFKGLKDKTLPATLIAFTKQTALELKDYIAGEGLFPVIGKPSSGKQGLHVELLSDVKETETYINNFFRNYRGNNSALIFQKYIEINKEYRVLVLDGSSMGCVEKMPSPNSVARNAKRGSEFAFVKNQPVESFAETHVSSKGFVGVDIAIDIHNFTYMIESNRSPRWEMFQKTSGINVAEKIMLALEKRIRTNNELF
jgi:glutathione synthase/RimK-type ligase-like ATP-grasp enzyme